jgi:Na+-transporting methylmalonyl-CoA/oxaloacetate decarboxylase gamma subunit
MKKFATILSILVIFVMLLSACATPVEETPNNTAEEAAPAEESEASEEASE